MLSTQYTDNGGRGTQLALEQVVSERNMTRPDYVVCIFLLHNPRTRLNIVVTNILSERRLNDKNEALMNATHGLLEVNNM